MNWSFWRPSSRATAPLSLALQGGGAHGAFTWGVLDALLTQEDFRLHALSGASAGAMNAVVLAHGLLQGGWRGGPDAPPPSACRAARAALRSFWHALGTRLPFGWATTGEGESTSLAPAVRAALRWSQWLSPYQFNPMGLDPLRQIVEDQIDFAALRRASPVELFVATTHAATGRLRLFREHEITADALLASACLPNLHHSVLIDGQAYWDGGFSANPPVWPLVNSAHASDLMLVLLSPPTGHADPPRTAHDIRHQAQELAFHAPLMRELEWLADWRDAPSGWPASARERRLRHLRLHLVDGRAHLATLAGETRLIAHLPFLEHLRALGEAAGRRWWGEHGRLVGRSSTVDLAAVWEGVAA
ncbi:patatin-like phospholipase family protein [Ideonella sp. DXS29W]|uniref:Patatin-like phospholipase family protein n=1 Tax=Ideonella lacteola TaxID=2984193 RepID=A0ABU9BN44_9BURK